jgi:type IV secretory pathway TrbL component
MDDNNDWKGDIVNQDKILGDKVGHNKITISNININISGSNYAFTFSLLFLLGVLIFISFPLWLLLLLFVGVIVISSVIGIDFVIARRSIRVNLNVTSATIGIFSSIITALYLFTTMTKPEISIIDPTATPPLRLIYLHQPLIVCFLNED